MPINIQIQGIEDLIAFVAIVKGEEITAAKIRSLISDLNTSSNKLEEAVRKQGEKSAAKDSR